MGGPTGLDEGRVATWLEGALGLAGPISATLIAGGRSNLTYRVEDAQGTVVALRRPPLSHVLPTAHDVAREFRIISGLFPLGVPVARPLALCEDEGVTGAPFYVMEFVEGAVVRDRAGALAAFDEPTRHAIGEHLATTLAGLHALAPEAAGLGDLARHDGYVERQLKRWRTQFEQTRVPVADLENRVLEVADRLGEAVPPAQRVSVVHGDYRLDNTVLAPEGTVRAILDWEICTLGDPLADLGTLLCYWAEPGDPAAALLGVAPTTAPGFMTRAQVTAAYARASGLDLSRVAYYQAFAYWRLACILQGVFARYRAGATAGDAGSVDGFPAHVALLADLALATLER
ncbi:MAG: phosphotransferase family protein [Acidimicrobiales bacterium]